MVDTAVLTHLLQLLVRLDDLVLDLVHSTFLAIHLRG